MNLNRRQAIHRTVTTLAGLALANTALASAPGDYPNKPIRIIVPFPAGTGLDVDSRFFAVRIGAVLGQPLIIENRPGAAGTIGTDYAAHQPADGYTLYMGSTSALSYIPLLYTKLNYKLTDFTAVSQLALLQGALIANPNVQARNAAELVELSKAKPGSIRAATQGVGSFSHMVGEWFVATTGAQIEFVPYNTSSPFASVLAGETQIIFDALPASMGNIAAGRLKALAITGKARHSLLPEVPTYREVGMQAFDPFTWFGLMAPAGTPPALIERVSAACAQVAKQTDAIERYRAFCGEPVGNTPAEFTALIKAEQAKWAPVVQRTGIRFD